MALKHRKKLLAIEWTWLLTGAAVVLAFTVEAWAAPHVPVLWMLGMLVLFFAYRFAITLYEINWPEPEISEVDEADEMERQRGDGIAGTVVYALPQMRGRSVPQDRDKKRAEEAAKLSLPSAEGVFEDDNLDTVFGIVAEDTSPTPAQRAGQPGLFGVTVYEREELRPETEADMTGTDIPIPSFAESQLTSLEREKALKNKMSAASPPMSAAVAAVVNRGASSASGGPQRQRREGLFGLDILKDEAPREKLRPETEADMTGTDMAVPNFAESLLTTKERERRDKVRQQSAQNAPTSSTTSSPLNARRAPARPRAAAPDDDMAAEPTRLNRPINLSQVNREATRQPPQNLARPTPGRARRDEMRLDEMKLDEITDDEIKLDDLLFEDGILGLDDEIDAQENTHIKRVPSALRRRTPSGEESS